MINLVLLKKEMLRFVQDVRSVREVERGILDHHVEMCKVRLVGIWIKRREVVDGAMRIKSENLKGHECREGYARSHEGKRVE